MNLKSKIQSDLKTALLTGEKFTGEVLRGLKAAILNEEVAAGKREDGLTNEVIEKIIAREVKKRRESAALYETNGRSELAENENKEIAVLEKYLPQQMSEDELRAVVKTKIEELGGADMKLMGQVIGAVKKEVGNSADGAAIARIVKEELSA